MIRITIEKDGKIIREGEYSTVIAYGINDNKSAVMMNGAFGDTELESLANCTAAVLSDIADDMPAAMESFRKMLDCYLVDKVEKSLRKHLLERGAEAEDVDSLLAAIDGFARNLAQKQDEGDTVVFDDGEG